MKPTLKVALVALAIAGGSVMALSTAAITPAMADSVTVGVGPGGAGIAFGYNDGYWDRSHAWHTWRDEHEATTWREANADHYYGWKHDRDKDMGWHEDHWWDKH